MNYWVNKLIGFNKYSKSAGLCNFSIYTDTREVPFYEMIGTDLRLYHYSFDRSIPVTYRSDFIVNQFGACNIQLNRYREGTFFLDAHCNGRIYIEHTFNLLGNKIDSMQIYTIKNNIHIIELVRIIKGDDYQQHRDDNTIDKIMDYFGVNGEKYYFYRGMMCKLSIISFIRTLQ
jgi:hypothetical protein